MTKIGELTWGVHMSAGEIMSAIACVAEGDATTDDDVREYMSGNLFRCGAYRGIVAAIRDVGPLHS